jgi:hypothetical protein
MKELNSILNEFTTLNLNQVERVKLLDRMELKYILTIENLPEILSKLSNDYYLLTTGGTGLRHYENRYYDTPDLRMYLDHHNGKLNRFKVRFRKYVDTGNTFFEIKLKNNKGRTVKTRLEVPDEDYRIHGNVQNILQAETGYSSYMLYESLVVKYQRITLIKKQSAERVTFDVDLSYRYGTEDASYPCIVVAEVKQPRSTASVFTTLMHNQHIHPFSFSKYCLGIASVYPDVKDNNFKTKIYYVKKLCQ